MVLRNVCARRTACVCRAPLPLYDSVDLVMRRMSEGTVLTLEAGKKDGVLRDSDPPAR